MSRIASFLARVDRSLEKLYDRANVAGRGGNWGEHLRLTERIGGRLRHRARVAPPRGGPAKLGRFKAPPGGLMR